jgi:hypothetical protein
VRLRAAALAGAAALAITAAAGADAPHWRAWLCSPAVKTNYCNTDLSTTVYWPDGSATTVEVAAAKSAVDCFYVYPTVSLEPRGNADLKIQDTEKYTVLAQAARFSQVCRVFAPVYRQTTVYRLGGSPDVAYRDVLAAWRDYVAHWNDGRGVVLIGHSQGAFMLERLVREQLGSIRPRLVSALLLGGDVTVGGDERYAGLSACRSPAQTGCIVAYSSWGETPPAGAALLDVDDPAKHLLCVNPAAPAGGSAPITPIFPWFLPEGITPGPVTPRPSTLWVAFPELYRARCVRSGTRSWLLVTRVATPGDPRPTVRPVLARGLGLHAADVNIALGALINLVRAQTKSYLASH